LAIFISGKPRENVDQNGTVEGYPGVCPSKELLGSPVSAESLSIWTSGDFHAKALVWGWDIESDLSESGVMSADVGYKYTASVELQLSSGSLFSIIEFLGMGRTLN